MIRSVGRDVLSWIFGVLRRGAASLWKLCSRSATVTPSIQPPRTFEMSEPHWETAEKVETANVDVREIRDLLEEIRKQNALLKRYLFVFGAALALLLLMQFPVVSKILEIVLVVSIVLAILLTAPVWSRGISYLLDRLPWFRAWTANGRSPRERDL